MRLGREDGSSLEPGLYYEIRYESLIDHPADECAGLCTFLGLPTTMRCSASMKAGSGRSQARCEEGLATGHLRS